MSVIISDHTITTNNVTQKLLGGLKSAAASRVPCALFAVQNRHAANSLYIKAGTANSTADNTTDSIIVLAGEYKILGPLSNGFNVYNLDEIYIHATTATHPYSVERVVA